MSGSNEVAGYDPCPHRFWALASADVRSRLAEWSTRNGHGLCGYRQQSATSRASQIGEANVDLWHQRERAPAAEAVGNDTSQNYRTTDRELSDPKGTRALLRDVGDRVEADGQALVNTPGPLEEDVARLREGGCGEVRDKREPLFAGPSVRGT